MGALPAPSSLNHVTLVDLGFLKARRVRDSIKHWFARHEAGDPDGGWVVVLPLSVLPPVVCFAPRLVVLPEQANAAMSLLARTAEWSSMPEKSLQQPSGPQRS